MVIGQEGLFVRQCKDEDLERILATFIMENNWEEREAGSAYTSDEVARDKQNRSGIEEVI